MRAELSRQLAAVRSKPRSAPYDGRQKNQAIGWAAAGPVGAQRVHLLALGRG